MIFLVLLSNLCGHLRQSCVAEGTAFDKRERRNGNQECSNELAMAYGVYLRRLGLPPSCTVWHMENIERST